MKHGAPRSFGAQLKALREAAGFTQEELATIAGLSVHAVSALERGERRRPHVETVRALSAALDLTGAPRDEFVGSARAPTHHTAADELRRVSLPAPVTALFGRDTELSTLHQWLAEPECRLVTVIGPGGVGKTRLALELAHAVANEGSTRVLFVPLAHIRDTGLVACEIAEALGLADLTASDLPGRARAACAGQPTLLVVDNFEQVLGAAPLLADLLASVAVLRLLVTSRAPTRVRGEREYALEPLALEKNAEGMSTADLARVPAVRVFMERVRDVLPGFCLTRANSPTVAAICRRLDALPLALELAARWMKVLTPEDLLHRLSRDPLLSNVGPRDLPERQTTMNATVAWSYQLLDSSTQRAFRRLGALPGRFSIDAAAAVISTPEHDPSVANALNVLSSLVDKSLLLRAETAVASRPLYRMLDTMRAFAARELAASGDADAAMEGLIRYCAREATLAFNGLVGSAQVEWLHRVHEDLENYRDAMNWLIEHGRGAEACDIAWGLLFFWLIRGHTAEGLWWYEATLKEPSLPPGAESRALTGAALMWFAQRELGKARSALTRALALLSTAGDNDAVVRAEAADIFARVEMGPGNLAAAHEWFERAAKEFTALALPWGAGSALIGMSAIPLETGDAEQAERLLDDAMPLLRHAGPWFMARALIVRAILAVRRQVVEDAFAFVRQSLTHILDLHDKHAFVYAAVPFAAAAALKGDDPWAARVLGARDMVTERTGARIVYKPVHDLSEQLERDVRERLGPDRWSSAYEEGRSGSIDALLVEIDRALPAAT